MIKSIKDAVIRENKRFKVSVKVKFNNNFEFLRVLYEEIKSSSVLAQDSENKLKLNLN